MTTETSIEKDVKDLIDADKLIKDIFGKDKNRNDLAIGVYNDCDSPLQIGYYVEHGNLKSVPAGGLILSHEEWEAGVHAVGAGSNITLNITMPNGSGWAIMAATPVNKQNYVKIATSSSGFDSGKEAYKKADKEPKKYSSSSVEETHNGYTAIVHITNESPAACTIVFTPAD